MAIPKHPIQPVHNVDGVLRFRENAIVRYLLDNNGPKVGMNELAVMPFSVEDREQFAQLIGYSLSGYSELSYTTDETLSAAERMYDRGVTEDQALIEYLEMTLGNVRKGLRVIVPEVFRIHPDDLVT